SRATPAASAARPFALGRWGLGLNIVSVFWGLMVIVKAHPPFRGVGRQTMALPGSAADSCGEMRPAPATPRKYLPCKELRRIPCCNPPKRRMRHRQYELAPGRDLRRRPMGPVRGGA